MSQRSGKVLKGQGTLRGVDRAVVPVTYAVNADINGQANIVELDPEPVRAKDGDVLQLTLEDGRWLNCQKVDDSRFCAVIGDGPRVERRSRLRT